MNTPVYTVTPEAAKRCIALAMKNHLPIMLNGNVGCGKTTAVKDFVTALQAKGLDIQLQIRTLGQMDLSDFSLPKEINGRVVPCPASWLPLKEDEKPEDPTMIIFLDEFDRASVEVQNITLNLLLDRRISNKELSSKVHFVGAQNGSSDIYTTALSKAAVQRFCMLYIKSTFESYERWALENNISPARIAFDKFHADALIDQSVDFEDISLPSRRNLDMVDKLVTTMNSPSIKFETSDIYAPMIAGLIGVPAAIEYIQFMKLYEKIPMADAVVANPKNVDTSGLDPSTLYALMQSVVRYASPDLNRCDAAFQFFMTLSPEFCEAGMSSIIQKNPDACTCKTYCSYKNS